MNQKNTSSHFKSDFNEPSSSSNSRHYGGGGGNKNSNNNRGGAVDEDDEIARAIELSKQTAKDDEKKRKH